MLIQHVFPLDGEYDFRIARSGVGVAQAGVGGDEELEISVNGERVYLVGRNSPRDIRLAMKAGPQSIGVAVLKKRNVRGVDDLYDVLRRESRCFDSLDHRSFQCFRSGRDQGPPAHFHLPPRNGRGGASMREANP